MFIHFWERERHRLWVGEGQRERETQNPKQVPDSELSAWTPTWGSNSWTARSWPELKSDARPTELPRCPYLYFLHSFYFLREREREWAGEGQGERERESQAGSMLSAEPNTVLIPTTPGSWPEAKPRVGHSTDWATQTLQELYLNMVPASLENSRIVWKDVWWTALHVWTELLEERGKTKSIIQVPRRAFSSCAETILKSHLGARGWLSQLSVQLWLRSRSHGSWGWALCRAPCTQLGAWSLLRILCSLSLCPSPGRSLSLSQK